MTEADKDGRVAQMVGDLIACLDMSLHEAMLDMQRIAEELIPTAVTEATDETTEGRG